MVPVTIRAARTSDAGEIAEHTNIKTQYSFIKPLDAAAAARVRAFVPRMDAGN